MNTSVAESYVVGRQESLVIGERARASRVPPTWAVFGVLVILAALAMPKAIRKMPDFEVYRLAAERIRSAEPLYRSDDGHYQYKYLPAFALLTLPLARLPEAEGKMLWYAILVAGIVAFNVKSLGLLPCSRLAPHVLVAGALLAMAKFYAHELTLGQCNVLMAACVVTGFVFLKRQQAVPAGSFLALAVLIKAYPVIFLPYLLATKRFAAFGVFVTLLVVCLLAPATIYGGAGNLLLLESWARTLSESTRINLLNQDSVSIWAMYAKWFGIGTAALLLAAVTVVGIFGVVFALVRRGSAISCAEYLDMAVLLMLIPLISPQGWDYGLLMATPAVMLLLNEFQRLSPSMRLVSGAALFTMAFSVFDLMGRYAYAAFMSVSAITVCALAVLIALASLRVRRLA